MKKYILGIITGAIITTLIGISAALLYDAKDISFTPSDSEWNVNNMQDAIEDIKENYISKSEFVGKTWEFDYLNDEQIFIVPFSGIYKLEVWGAQGGDGYLNSSFNRIGGYGAYSVGEITLSADSEIYINVGGQGESSCLNKKCAGGYNGGGKGGFVSASYTILSNGGGGGATHMALDSGELYKLSSHQTDNRIIIVAGGGGGGTAHTNTSGTYGFSHNGGNAGGYVGYGECSSSAKADSVCGSGCGGTQTSTGGVSDINYSLTGQFGAGGSATCDYQSTTATRKCYSPGAGGGWYGGSTGTHGVAGGGSGYISNSNLTNKAMYCYNCTTSNVESTKTISNTCVNSSPIEQCSKKGNGYARITLVSID